MKLIPNRRTAVRLKTSHENDPAQRHGHASVPHRMPKSISSFIAGFKSAVNSKIDDYIDQNNLKIPKYNRKNHFFQPNYHDRIIRDEKAYRNISNYIKNNPAKWQNDSFRSKPTPTPTPKSNPK